MIKCSYCIYSLLKAKHKKRHLHSVTRIFELLEKELIGKTSFFFFFFGFFAKDRIGFLDISDGWISYAYEEINCVLN